MIRARPALSLIAACLAFAVFDARAETVFGLHVASIHAPQRMQNNTNPGLYVRHGQWAAGGYKNSYRRTTLYGGYAHPVGPAELMLGIATGYRRECSTTTTHTPAVVKHEKFDNGDTSTTTTPARTVSTEECTGFAKHRLTPLAAFSYAVPFSALGAAPRLWVMRSKHGWIAHAGIEWSIK